MVLAGLVVGAVSAKAAEISFFTGGDILEGLDLDGNFAYAIDFGGDGGVQIRDAVFTDSSVAGVAVNRNGAPHDTFGKAYVSEYGDGTNDNALEQIVSTNSLVSSPLEVDLDVTTGVRYRLQIVVADKYSSGRFLDHNVDLCIEDQLAVDSFKVGAEFFETMVITHDFTALDNQLNLRFEDPGDSVGTNAITLEVLGASGSDDDRDKDGLLDDWERHYHGQLTQSGSDDPDGDGLDNTKEFELRTDPTKADTDGDSLTDAAEINDHQSDPLSVDGDGDGVPDKEEIETHGTAANRADSDGDGFKDGFEIVSGSDPSDADVKPDVAPAQIQVNIITGPDPSEGLDLQTDPGEEFVYAINFAPPGRDTVTVAGVDFITPELLPGVFVGATKANPRTKPEFGKSSDENNLEELIDDIYWEFPFHSMLVNLPNPQIGAEYHLQMMFAVQTPAFDNDPLNDVVIEGDKVVDKFNMNPPKGGMNDPSRQAWVISYQFVAQDPVINIEFNVDNVPRDNAYLVISALTLESMTGETADDLLTENFDADDGGFVEESSGNSPIPFEYNDTGTWSLEGDDSGPSTYTLTSPEISVPVAAAIRVTFDHRYSIEPEWDGLALQVAVNGGDFQVVPNDSFSQNGYTFSNLIGNHVLKGGDGFNGDSAGYGSGEFITSIADVEGVGAGGKIRFRFLGAFDEGARGPGIPNWEIDSVSVETLDDSDGDGMPDSYEDGNGLDKNVDDASGDGDGDTVSNLDEFLNGTNPQSKDTDGDGLEDNVETGTGAYLSAANTGTDPKLADSDEDGLIDGVETNTGTFVSATETGSDPNSSDTDGDAEKDGFEVAAGSDPNDPESTTSILEVNGGFTVEHVWTAGNPRINNAFDAEGILDDPGDAEAITVVSDFIHFHDNVNAPIYQNESKPYPLFDEDNGGAGPGNREDFAIRAIGQIRLNVGGLVTFACNSDDGFDLIIDDDSIGFAPNRTRNNNTFMKVELTVGLHDLTFIHWERAGGAGVSVYIYKGIGAAPTTLIEEDWQLVGAFVSEPFQSQIDSITLDAAGKVTLAWPSSPGETFAIETSANLQAQWEEVFDGHPSGGDTTTFEHTPAEGVGELYYRVRRE